MPTPEEEARELIDAKLKASGWIVQTHRDMNLAAGLGEIFPKVVDGRDSSSGEFGSIFEDHSCNDLRQQRTAVELSPMFLS